jgi:RimJ/RimL family protein N-acetyltransferase
MIDLLKLKNNFPLLEGAQVRLQLFDESHITDNYLAWLNDPVVVRYSSQRFIEHTHETSAKYLASFVGTENLLLAVYLKETRRYVGTMSVYFSRTEQSADIGILIGDPSCWGQGVGGDAWRTVLYWLIDVAQVNNVTGGTLRCNTGMVNIMVNSGMQLVRVDPAHALVEGQLEDALYFSKSKYRSTR